MSVHCSARFVYLLAAMLFVSTVVPCGLMEQAPASVCAEPPSGGGWGGEAGPASAPISDGTTVDVAKTAGDHLDCCAACLRCCPTYMAASASAPHFLADTSQRASFSLIQAPLGSPHAIWHPPRW